jgi:hypothetical protein
MIRPFRRDAGSTGGTSVARTKKTARKAARRPKRRAASARKTASSRNAVRRRKAAPRKSAAKTVARRKASPRKAAPRAVSSGGKRARASRGESDSGPAGIAAFSPTGEVYGEESWKEEELSAAELEVPELDELDDEIEGPEIGEESDDSEW